MKSLSNWSSAFLRSAALLFCGALLLGLAPQQQAIPSIPGYIVTPFASVPYTRGVVFDTAGNLLTLGVQAGTVYSIDPAGQKRVLADLPDVTAGYAGPAFDPVSGNVYVSRYLNQSGHEILRIAPDGSVSVFASGIPVPLSLTTDAVGNLYVTSYACPASVYKVTPNGTVSVFATGLCRADGPEFDGAGNLYVCDRSTNQVMRVPPGGGVATVFASGFDIPTGIVFDEQGNLLVANSNNGTITRVDSQGVTSPFGTGFTNPVDLAFDHAGQIFIADLGAGQIYKATPIEPIPPIAGRLTINGGALVTTSANVRLDVSATNADESQVGLSMSFSNDGDSWSAWEPYADSSLWQLAGDDGAKTVYGRFKNSSGALSDVVSDTIVLDTSVQSEYGMTINNGALFANRTEVQLTISAKPHTAEMQVSNDGGFNGVAWEPYTSHKRWQITRYRHQEITRLVYIRFRDIDGNVSPMYLDDIILDVHPPGGHVQVANTNQGMLLYLAATDDVSGVEGMRLSVQPDFAGASWEPFASSRTWNFGANPNVYVQFRDNAGNLSPVYAAALTGAQTVFLPIVVR
jgi:sugar lactone lactonase YvrE